MPYISLNLENDVILEIHNSIATTPIYSVFTSSFHYSIIHNLSYTAKPPIPTDSTKDLLYMMK